MASRARIFRNLVLNRTLILLAAAFAWCSWNGWYSIFAADKNQSLLSKIAFTLAVIGAAFLISLWYFDHQKFLTDASKELLSEGSGATRVAKKSRSRQSRLSLGDGEEDDQDPFGDHGVVAVHAAALAEKSFGNLTNAMSFVVAEVWLADSHHPYRWNVGASFVYGVVGIVVMILFEVAQRRFAEDSYCHSFLALLEQMLVGSFAWFICVPIKDVWKGTVGIPDEEPAPLWLGAICLLVAVLFTTASSLAMSRLCQQASPPASTADDDDDEDGSADDEDPNHALTALQIISSNRKPLCENAVTLYQNVYFNVAASMLKDTLLTPQGDAQFLVGVTVFVFADAVLLFLESSEAPEDAKEAVSVGACTKLKADLVAMITRVMSYLAAHITFNEVVQKMSASDSPWIQAVFACVCQGLALLTEEFRMRWIVRGDLQEAALDKSRQEYETLGEEDAPGISSGSDSDGKPRRRCVIL